MFGPEKFINRAAISMDDGGGSDSALESKKMQKIQIRGEEEEKAIFNLNLDAKIDDYKKRIKPFEDIIASDHLLEPEENTIYIDGKYKILIGDFLRMYGSVQYGDIYDLIMKQDNEVNQMALDSAWKVMNAYAEGNMKNVRGGSGFPKVVSQK